MRQRTHADAVRWAIGQPDGMHVVTTSMLGKTAAHLTELHPEQPVSKYDKSANLRAHFRAHRIL